MAEQTAGVPESRLSALAEDAGRIAESRTVRLVFILIALVLYSEIAPMQLAAVSIIVPKIAVSFPGAGAGVTWASTIVGVAGGATIALVGKLGDRWGKRRITMICGVLFIVGTLLCVLTSSWPVFLAGRALGSASFALTALEYGLVRDLLPRKWIPIAVGVLGTGFGIGGVVTPIIVGALTDNGSWRSVFWFMLIYTAVTTLLFFVVPETPLRAKVRLDVPGAVLFGASIATALVYVSEGSSWGWADLSCLAYLIVGVVLFIAWILWELRTPEPMMDLRLLAAPRVSILMGIAFFITLAISAVSIMVAYMFQTPKQAALEDGVLAAAASKAHQPVAVMAKIMTFRGDLSYANGMSTLSMALHITLWTALFMVVFGTLGGFLARRHGCRPLLIAAGAAMLAGSVVWVFYHSTWQEQVAVGVLYGLCGGFYYAANPNLLIDTIPAGLQGIGAAMLAVWGAVGTSVGTAIFTAVVAAHPFQVVASEAGHTIVTSVPQVYTNAGYSWAYVTVCAIPAFLALALALALRTGRSGARGGAGATEAAADVAPVIEAA